MESRDMKVLEDCKECGGQLGHAAVVNAAEKGNVCTYHGHSNIRTAAISEEHGKARLVDLHKDIP